VAESLAAISHTPDPAENPLGCDEGQAQSAAATAAGSVWVAHGPTDICAVLDTTLADPLTGVGEQVAPAHCDTDRGALAHGLAEAGTYYGRHIIWGLVPNGNRTVTVRLASSATVTVTVSSNAFAAEVPGAVRALRFLNADGAPVTAP